MTTTLPAQIITLSRALKWKSMPNYVIANKKFVSFKTFKGADHKTATNYLPVYHEVIPLPQGGIESVDVKPEGTETILTNEVQSFESLTPDFQINYYVAYQHAKPFLVLNLIPLTLNNGSVQQLNSFTINIKTKVIQNFTSSLNKKGFAANSVLASGDWFKIATLTNGIYRIDYATLRNLGINPDAIDPRNIQLYGHGAGMLPQQNDKTRIDDLAQIPIMVKGEDDGRFNPGDYIAFYGESQLNRWSFQPATQTFNRVSNIYCDTTYYFLTVSTQPGKRMQKINSENTSSATVNTYRFLYYYENEKANLIRSGKIWVGEEFDRVTQQSFNVSIPDLVTSSPINLKSSVTARSFIGSSFDIKQNGTSLLTQTINPVSPAFTAPYTSGLVQDEVDFTSTSANFTLDYVYNKPASGSIGWLDYFEIKAKAILRNNNGNFIFRDLTNIGQGNKTQFDISTNSNLTVLDVSNPVAPFIVNGSFSSNTYSFTTGTDSLKTFAVFDGGNFYQVINAGKIANQNLHGLSYADGFIISHPNFLAESERLAAHHRKRDNLSITVVNIQDIYNEFSSGAPDMTAVRDFLRMFYKRATSEATMPKYALLMGRASYDYKYRLHPNTNFVPTFESVESFAPETSYCSDDFFGYLDDNEGGWDYGANVGEMLDIGIGRLPASNNEEASNMVNKVIAYTSKDALANWRNTLVFTADDAETNMFQNDTEGLTNAVSSKTSQFNIEKIYLDAYKLESTAGGARYPDAQNAFNNAIEKGCLVFNYVGHGGEVGLTAERVLGIDDINSWTNGSLSTGSIRLPLFMTATCEFSRFDDPARTSAGELVLLNPNGGGIGLFTTVRLVFSNGNLALNEAFYDNIGFDSISQLNPPRFGDIIKRTKNAYIDNNTRNFTLLGDPFLTLAYPNYNVKTTQINGIDVTTFADTLKALKKVEISGIVTYKNGAIANNFTGLIYPTVYDKKATYTTLGNTPGESTPMQFGMQNNVLYRGKASVTNGAFKFTFIVPKDIAYEYGKGKISYYAEDNITDANGFTNSIVIGGTSDSINADHKGPDLKLYLNDVKFVNGGITNENPIFIAKLFDENGINTTGKGIGRDLTGVLNNNNTQSVVMNDFYQATTNSYQSGEVTYKYKNLPVGKHQIRFKAYDVYNNLSEATIDFEVKKSDKPLVDHLLNYPNPFNNFTTFHFDHNQISENLSVMIQIFTVSGRLVKTLQTDFLSVGNHFDQLTWDGRDDYGDRLAKGVYLYKVRLKSPGQKVAEKMEKLVILN